MAELAKLSPKELVAAHLRDSAKTGEKLTEYFLKSQDEPDTEARRAASLK